MWYTQQNFRGRIYSWFSQFFTQLQIISYKSFPTWKFCCVWYSLRSVHRLHTTFTGYLSNTLIMQSACCYLYLRILHCSLPTFLRIVLCITLSKPIISFLNNSMNIYNILTMKYTPLFGSISKTFWYACCALVYSFIPINACPFRR